MSIGKRIAVGFALGALPMGIGLGVFCIFPREYFARKIVTGIFHNLNGFTADLAVNFGISPLMSPNMIINKVGEKLATFATISNIVLAVSFIVMALTPFAYASKRMGVAEQLSAAKDVNERKEIMINHRIEMDKWRVAAPVVFGLSLIIGAVGVGAKSMFNNLQQCLSTAYSDFLDIGLKEVASAVYVENFLNESNTKMYVAIAAASILFALGVVIMATVSCIEGGKVQS